MPVLSIITINLNNASGLRKTIESVVSQSSREFEYIVIDGGSTDGSIEVIKEFETRITYWVSEPDTGIYHAMNKGIRAAKGEYCQFLNSGDWLVNELVVEKILNGIPDCDIFIGNVITTRPDGKIRVSKALREISFMTFYRSTLPHSSAYIRRSLFTKYGLYDESLLIVGDWKWYLVVAGLHDANIVFTDIAVSFFDSTGISNRDKLLANAERRKVLKELIPSPVLADYDKYNFEIDQIDRIKRYPLFYSIVWFIERCLFKVDKWKAKYCGWKRSIR